MNILITGANGQLGRTFRDLSRGFEHKYFFTDIVEDESTIYLDITDVQALNTFITENQIEVIVNCAAYTDVARAEEDESVAMKINAIAPGILAGVAKESGAVLFHISTDYIFDGHGNKPYTEADLACPISAYGRTKIAGEKAILDSGCKYIILRAAWLYSHYGKNFFKTIEDKCSKQTSINVVIDQLGTPTYAPDLALAILRIIDDSQMEKCGIYHFTNEGVCSWYDFAVAINRAFGYLCDVKPCATEDFPSKVSRPTYSVLDKSLFKKTFCYEIPHWEDSLLLCVQEYNR